MGVRARLVLGGSLVLAAMRRWCRRPTGGAEVATPKWMTAIDSFSPARVLAMGALLAGLNPKNLMLAVAAPRIQASRHATQRRSIPDRDPFWWNLLVNRPEVDDDGGFALPTAPGFGWVLDETYVDRYRIDRR